ncbi:Transcriptional regulator, LysR family protein [Minicystis rosea]|nr:Transcriptional regulator, LysR family protein [Minicystis rosea]
MPLDLSGLPALLVVAEKRSFTAAAAELGVTPSAVSQTVRALEERVGVRLLQRTTRSVGLTEAGARFIAHLEPALAGVREAFELLGEHRDRPAGLLRLTVPRLGYMQIVGPKLAAFLAAYPDIQLEMDIDDAFTDIVARGFDAGIRIGEMVDREMVGVRVSGDMRVAVVASPAYFAARGKPKHPRDLVAHDCINYRRRALGVVYHWEFTEDGKDFELGVTGRVLVNDADFMVGAALDGLGVAYVMESTVREHLAEKRLVRVLDAYCPPFPGFFLYYPSRAHLAPKLQALVDFLKVKRPSRAGSK